MLMNLLVRVDDVLELDIIGATFGPRRPQHLD